MERKILVVEDSPTQAERLCLLLEGEGYRVDVARHGREGLDRVRLAPPDLIISDVVMPEMDGYAFCQAIKAAEGTRRIPFVLLTERKTPADIVIGLERGADNFITKPFEDDYLLERVRRIFEQVERRNHGHLEMEVRLRVGAREIVINTDKQQIIELLFATFEELCRLNAQLDQSKRSLEGYAKNLEAEVQKRTWQLEEELDARKRLTSILEATPDCVGIVDSRSRWLYLNRAGRRMLGFGEDEALSRLSLYEIYPEAGRRAARERVEAAIRDGVWSGESTLAGPDGREVPVSQVLIAHRAPDGSVEFLSSIARDMSERKRLQEQLIQAEKLAAMGSLLAGVAHELNNPLSVILGHTALLRQSLAGGPLEGRAEKIGEAATRCTRIVKNFLALARKHSPEREQVSLNQVVMEAVELLAYPLRLDDVEVKLDLAREAVILWADPHQLHQVLVNLITNAHQAMRETPPPRRLTLTTRLDAGGRRARLEVGDTGPGVPPALQSRIFEPFFTTKPAGTGTGLGLSICRGIVEAHRGSIGMESRPGQGAAFGVELPVETPSTANLESVTAPPPPPVRGKRILVVDDEPEIRSTIADILAIDGHRVDTAANGVIALAKLGEGSYDLVVSDVKMPLLDGSGLYREVERHHPRLLQRFVFLTGDTLGRETEEFLERVRTLSLSKPFDLAQVRRVVQAALAASDAEPAG